MKTILLLRHGKSDWRADYQGDHNRPLKKRGHNSARLMGQWAIDNGYLPEYLISSTALRCRLTSELFAEELTNNIEMDFRSELYLCSATELLNSIRELDDDVSCVLVCNHEPCCSAFIELCSGECFRFPTAALAVIEFQTCHWRKLEQGAGKLKQLILPRELM